MGFFSFSNFWGHLGRSLMMNPSRAKLCPLRNASMFVWKNIFPVTYKNDIPVNVYIHWDVPSANLYSFQVNPKYDFSIEKVNVPSVTKCPLRNRKPDYLPLWVHRWSNSAKYARYVYILPFSVTFLQKIREEIKLKIFSVTEKVGRGAVSHPHEGTWSNTFGLLG